MADNAGTNDQFPGSVTRHGTAAGFAMHQALGERPCDPCYFAKQTYDKDYKLQPVNTKKNRISAKAQNRAQSILARKYKAEYDVLYAEIKAELLSEEGLT